jgi:hypothetical protein
MPASSEFTAVYQRLRAILQPYEDYLMVTADNGDSYSLDADYSEEYEKPVFFAAAMLKKNYVSFYLMPIYIYPELMDGISPDLQKHMQGKSCFNFKKVDDALFEELADLTRRGFDRYMLENLVALP